MTEHAQDALMRLHIGGRERKPGWTVLDIQPGPAVDIVGNCLSLRPIADASVEEIYASHVLEHLSYRDELLQALQEMARVLRPGGTLRISVPDFDQLVRLYLKPELTLQERFSIMGTIFGGQRDEHDFHKAGLTFELLEVYLEEAGFSAVERCEPFGLFNDFSAYRIHGERISLNLTARR